MPVACSVAVLTPLLPSAFSRYVPVHRLLVVAAFLTMDVALLLLPYLMLPFALVCIVARRGAHALSLPTPVWTYAGDAGTCAGFVLVLLPRYDVWRCGCAASGAGAFLLFTGSPPAPVSCSSTTLPP